MTRFIVFRRGQEMCSSLLAYCREHKIKAAHFTAIGAVSYVKLSYYDMKKKEYLSQKIKEDLEIASLIGNIAMMDDDQVLHAHGIFSDRKLHTLGGHVKEAVVSGTCEVFLTEVKEKLIRKPDDQTGLNLIQ